MKKHVMLALGFLMCVIYGFRMALALLEPGLGITEAYLAGGLLLSGWLIKGGLAEWRFARMQSS